MPRMVMLAVLALLMSSGLARAQTEPQALEVPGHRPAAFVPPSGNGPRPVVIALHGNFDRPEWICAAWNATVRGRAFILCPRGRPRTDAPGLDRWDFPASHILIREITAARAALAARFVGRVADGPIVYVGFSQGGHRIAWLAASDPSEYPRIQLVEGGNSLFREEGAARYARSQGRVAVVCALPWCERAARTLVTASERGPAEVMAERIPTAHHDLQTMGPAIRRTFEWLIEGDPRFLAPSR